MTRSEAAAIRKLEARAAKVTRVNLGALCGASAGAMVTNGTQSTTATASTRVATANGSVRALIPAPPTTNNLFANVPGKGRVKIRAYRKWLEVAVPLLGAMTQPFDPDNRVKGCLDAAVQAGVIPGDSWQFVAGVRVAVDVEEPRGRRRCVWCGSNLRPGGGERRWPIRAN